VAGSFDAGIVTSDVRVALLLGAASSLSVAGLFPYLLVVAPKLRTSTRPMWFTVLTQTVRAGFTMCILAWIGLYLGAPLGLDAPLVRAWVTHQFNSHGVGFMPLAAIVGAATGALILVLDRYVFLRSLPAVALESVGRAARWKGFLASFYGAIVEEILSRLFLMTVLVWILARVFGGASTGVFVAACVLSAIGFAAGHLPAVAQHSPLSRPVATRVLALNTLAGIVFGFFFWRYGLEHAMVAHFAADLVLHVAAA
jgi:membrane protease YdiL (CAAX protease family)